jgi:hypothetical protein
MLLGSVRSRPWVLALGLLGALLVAVCIGLAKLKIIHFPAPLVGYFLIGALCAVGAMVVLRKPAAKNVALAFLSSFLCLAGIETFFFVIGRPHTRQVTHPNLIRKDPQLGYGPVTNVKVKQQELHDGAVVFDAVYTIDRDGLRHIPGSNRDARCKAVFFGGSFAFGQGLNDDQTMPYYFLQAERGRYQGFNFAFGGYGPHQMLRDIETNRLARVVKRPDLVIYEAIPDHVRRALGLATWDRYGPHYMLEPNGSVRYVGPFHRHADKFRRWTRHCWTCRFVAAHSRWRRSPADVALFVAIVSQARDLIERRYGARFVVVLWDNQAGRQGLVQGLREKNITVYPMTEIISDVNKNRAQYVLAPFDLHPNARANRLIGNYLAEKLGGCK